MKSQIRKELVGNDWHDLSRYTSTGQKRANEYILIVKSFPKSFIWKYLCLLIKAGLYVFAVIGIITVLRYASQVV